MTKASFVLPQRDPDTIESVDSGYLGMFAGDDGKWYAKNGSNAPEQIGATDENAVQGLIDSSLEGYLDTTDTTIVGVLVGSGGVVRAATYDEVVPVVIQGINGSVPANPAGRYCHKTDYVNLATNGGTQYVNIVQTWGYNYDRANLAEPRCGFTIESNYALNNVGPYIFEAHIQAVYVDGTNYRPLQVNLPKTVADKAVSQVDWRAQLYTFNDYDNVLKFWINCNSNFVYSYMPFWAINTFVRGVNITAPELRTANKTFIEGDHLVATSSTRVFTLPNNPAFGQIQRVTAAGATVSVFTWPLRPTARIVSGANATTPGETGYVQLAANSSIELMAISGDLWVVVGGTPGVTHTWV